MVHLLHFSIAGMRGAIPLDESMQLVRMVKPGPASDAALGAVGMLNFHGKQIPIYSVRQLFGLNITSPRLTDNLIITQSDFGNLALWVEESFIVQDYDILIDNLEEEKDPESKIPGVKIFPDGLVLITDSALLIRHSNVPDSKKVINLVPGWSCEESALGYSSLPVLSANIKHIYDILSERADILALPEEVPHETSNLEVLTFQLVYSEYAVDLQYVRESVLTREITPVPGTPDYIIGIIAIRGEIIPLIDLRVLLNIPEKGLTDLNQVIVLTDGMITFGILADQITGILPVPTNQIRPSSADNLPQKSPYILGIGPSSLIIINAADILADPNMIVDDTVEPYVLPDIL